MAGKPKAVIIVAVVAVAIAVVASVSLYNYLVGQEERVERAVEQAVAVENVVVANKEIPIGTPIGPGQLKTVRWPKADVPPGVFFSKDTVQGRVALMTFKPGDPITQAKLRPIDGPAGIMIYKIPEGHRAMTVGVDQVSGVAGFLAPGNMVDLVLTAQPPGYKLPLSKIVLQNVPVLATGQIIEQQEGGAVIVPTVTLDVTPADAERLAMASSQGTLRLILRGSGDMDLARTSGANITKLIREANRTGRKIAKRSTKRKSTSASRPTVRRPVSRTTTAKVIVLRATSSSTQTFKIKEEKK